MKDKTREENELLAELIEGIEQIKEGKSRPWNPKN
jgi:hypothetical protein